MPVTEVEQNITPMSKKQGKAERGQLRGKGEEDKEEEKRRERKEKQREN